MWYNFLVGHLLPQKATICDYSMEDSFSNHSVFSRLEIRLRDSDSIYLRSFGFEIRNLSNFAEFKIRIQNSSYWRQNLRFGFEMTGESVESANSLLIYVVFAYGAVQKLRRYPKCRNEHISQRWLRHFFLVNWVEHQKLNQTTALEKKCLSQRGEMCTLHSYILGYVIPLM